MLCHEFEDQLTDYLDGTLEVHANQEFAEHAMRCPVCHYLLGEVKNTLQACSFSEAPLAGAELEARILIRTMPQTAISCTDFEEHQVQRPRGELPKKSRPAACSSLHP